MIVQKQLEPVAVPLKIRVRGGWWLYMRIKYLIHAHMALFKQSLVNVLMILLITDDLYFYVTMTQVT